MEFGNFHGEIYFFWNFMGATAPLALPPDKYVPGSCFFFLTSMVIFIGGY